MVFWRLVYSATPQDLPKAQPIHISLTLTLDTCLRKGWQVTSPILALSFKFFKKYLLSIYN